jgi:hypothetical protein
MTPILTYSFKNFNAIWLPIPRAVQYVPGSIPSVEKVVCIMTSRTHICIGGLLKMLKE